MNISEDILFPLMILVEVGAVIGVIVYILIHAFKKVTGKESTQNKVVIKHGPISHFLRISLWAIVVIYLILTAYLYLS